MFPQAQWSFDVIAGELHFSGTHTHTHASNKSLNLLR